ncbi:hypothetical protein ACFFMR_14170 [Micromonospora andamanensis]|uniref:Uncharacterized protein n=1 Tax=Micromonospora andamanensis TaxID=1287068 RepID=A0ABQ4I2R4_9ACTN|nr:hypothetical protein [Micromonospora andamanensis]GIJ12204.1 hypothetical protein Van01_54180 [Micromonospora andamanensis]
MDADRQLRMQAREILTTAHEGSHRPTLAWAVGVFESSHAMYPLRLSRTGDPLALCPGDGGGCSLPRGRWLDYTRTGGAWIRDGDLVRPLKVSWPEVAAVFFARPVPRDLIAQCAVAMQRRRSCDGPPFGVEWREIDRACSAAGLAVWRACRPADHGEQLDLFAAF